MQELFTINTIEFQSFTIYHLPSWKQIRKWVYLNILFHVFHELFFLFICLLIFGDLSKLILPVSICVALWDFYYMYLFFQDMEDDFNRLVDFLIHFWVSFQNFINVLQMFLDNMPWRQLFDSMES